MDHRRRFARPRMWVAFIVMTGLAGASACGDSKPPHASHHAQHLGGDPAMFVGHEDEATTKDVLAHIAESMSHHRRHFDETLAAMQAHGADAVHLLADEYDATTEGHYFRRWLLVHTLGEVQHEDAIPFLTTLLATDPPPEHGNHYLTTVDEELSIRLAALRALETLMRLGSHAAGAALREVIQSPHHAALRKEAVVAYLAAAPDHEAAKAELVALLPASEHGLLELERTTEPPPMPDPPSHPERAPTHGDGAPSQP